MKPAIFTWMLLGLMSLSIPTKAQSTQWPSADESGTESASVVNSDSEESILPIIPDKELKTKTIRLLLNEAMNLRHEKEDVLEFKVQLPVGTQIEIPENYEIRNADFRNSSGGVERSSTGFIYNVKVVSVTEQYKSEFPESKIAEINQTEGGLYIFASIVESIQGTKGNFAHILAEQPSPGFLKFYSSTGRPKFSYKKSLKKRFGAHLNKEINPESLPEAEREKWQRIYNELKKAVDRTRPTPKSYLMMDRENAKKWSIHFERRGIIATRGAWTIATRATAVRHGFASVPCAEFQSELLRQAYQRAGYRVTDDFNKAKGNKLIWYNTASVANFSRALYLAGWVPWNSALFKPPLGAFMMNASGLSPGHTYISAGDDGMLIVDNGSPQGRDLRKSTERTISIMYQTGVFFLPPGITPSAW
ncbi:hypothetical protein QJS83_16565 [Bdellovibrio sp. 22V]|uniref:hypothetical protein n=1 Tax=Bdellovibrio sp. 22V TaxID=3044166 RepID=UPI002542FD25|nr:hypothetical protein [Bdellovibrio sp. 22V]WII72076.1 hypothetical protein QJS83_16565 [Bdellovibrio sp. 22V]